MNYEYILRYIPRNRECPNKNIKIKYTMEYDYLYCIYVHVITLYVPKHKHTHLLKKLMIKLDKLCGKYMYADNCDDVELIYHVNYIIAHAMMLIIKIE